MRLVLATLARRVADRLYLLAAKLEHQVFERQHGRYPAAKEE